MRTEPHEPPLSSPAKDAGIAERLNDPGAAAIQPAAYAYHRAGTSALSPIAQEAIPLVRYAPGVLLVVIAIVAAGQQVDPDLWGHIRFGQAVLAQHHLVLKDPYSYSAPGHLWLNHEWLTEVLVAWLYNHVGVTGLKLWKFGCAAGTILLLADGMSETGAAASVRLNTLTAAALALMPQMEFRPQVFTFLLFASLLALLARHNYRGTAPLWLAVPLLGLWANLHGGFIVGLASLGVYTAIVAIQDLIDQKGIRCTTQLIILTIGATAATLLTPYGFGTWEAVMHALHNPLTRNVITDWQPLLFALRSQWSIGHLGVIYYLCAIALIATMVITFAMTPQGGDLPLVAIAMLMSVAAFAAVRNMPLAVIACAAPISRHFYLIFERRRVADTLAGAEIERASARSGVNQWVAAALAGAVVISSGLFSPRLSIGSDYPAGAVAFMRRNHLKGNILDAFGWGEYLIWHTAPESKVFFDGRYDTVFPQQIIQDYVVFYFDLPGGARVLSAYPHDFVLIPPQSAAASLMKMMPGWKVIYRDANSVLYARDDSPAAHLGDSHLEEGAVASRLYFP
jgi:hypothetical protein